MILIVYTVPNCKIFIDYEQNLTFDYEQNLTT